MPLTVTFGAEYSLGIGSTLLQKKLKRYHQSTHWINIMHTISHNVQISTSILSFSCHYSSYATNIEEAWAKRYHKNLLILFYEDLQQDIHKELRKVNDFIGTNLTANQINNVSRLNIVLFRCAWYHGSEVILVYRWSIFLVLCARHFNNNK